MEKSPEIKKESLHEQNRFYQKLYTSRASCKFTHKVYTGEKLTDDESEILEKPLTIEELGSALYSMKANKSPGSDGLPAEFLKIFWDKLKSIFKGVVDFIFEQGIMHISARWGIISLIPKKSKDLLLLKNWRPITLLNVDYKIIAKSLVYHLTHIFGQVDIKRTNKGL